MENTFIPPANPRFTDYPFREPGLTPDQLDWREKRNRAIKLFRDTGDASLAEEMGLFWNKADEERAREAKRLRFSDDPFSPKKLADKEMAVRYAPILEKRKKDAIKGMLALFKPIVSPYIVYRAIKGPLLTDKGHDPQVGDELWIDGFVSTSRNPAFAAECAVHEFEEGFVFIEIEPTPEAETVTLDNEVNGRREYESIFNVGQKLRIEKALPNFKADFHPLNKVAAYYVGTLGPV